MNKRLFLKDNFFKFKYQFFIFIFLLLFFNPLIVFAAGNGGLTDANYGVVKAPDLQTIKSDISRGGKMIFSHSIELGYFHYGESELLMKAKKSYGVDKAKNDKLGFINWAVKETGLNLVTHSVVLYPDCMIFNESYNDSPYLCTGWLYLYCEQDQYEEYARNIATIGKDYMPAYFEKGDTEGQVFIQFPAEYFYYPVSNMENTINEGCYQTQIYTPGEAYHSPDRISLMKTNSLDTMTNHYSSAKKVHDVDDFSVISGQIPDNMSIVLFNMIIKPEDVWILSFCNVGLIENLTNGIGNSYGDNNYPISKDFLNQTIERLWLGVGNKPEDRFDANGLPCTWEQAGSKGVKPDCEAVMAFMRSDELYKQTKNKNSINFYGFKTDGQNLGLDKIFTANGVGTMKSQKASRSNLINATKAIENMYNYLQEEVNKNKEFKMTPENIEDIFNKSLNGATTNVNANFLNINGLNVGCRYVWSTSTMYMMDNSETDVNFARDTFSQQPEWSITKYLTKYTWQLSNETLKNHVLTKFFSQSGNTFYNQLDEADKLKTTLIFLQANPSVIDCVARYNSPISRKLGGATGKEACKALNDLAKTNYDKWLETCLAIGDVIFDCFSVSEAASTGWNATYATLRNESGHVYYSTFSTGLNICQVMTPLPEVSDFVLSNSYNRNESTFAYSSSNTEVKYNPTARNVIDWMHGNVDTTVSAGGVTWNNSTLGGRGSVLSIIGPYNTVIDNSGNWNKYDINCVVHIGGTNYQGFTRDTNNVYDVDVETKPELAKKFDKNSENVSFDTLVYVGRIPEAGINDVRVDDIRVLSKASYNLFNENFDAGLDLDSASRLNIASYGATGTGVDTLSGFFAAMQTDYNTTILFNVYKSGSTNYNNQKAFQLRATPVAIQKLSDASRNAYKKEEYPEMGYKATGYSGLTPAGGFKSVSSGEWFNAGDVVAYRLDYRIPNKRTIESEINSMSSFTLLTKGQWYEEYGSVLSSDVDIWIAPKPTTDGTTKFTEINKNTNNDWVRMRIKSPIMDNIYFTSANVYGPKPGSENASERMVQGVLAGFCGGNGHIWKHEVKNITKTGSGSGDTYITCTWRYWCRGKTAAEADPNDYNYITYYNGFKLDSGKINGKNIGSGTYNRDFSLSDKRPELTFSPSTDFMNAAKERSIRLQVPKTECNDYAEDWEIIIVTFDLPEKNNQVFDLVLIGSDGQEYGNVNRNNGNQHEAQQIPAEMTNASLYAIVERLKPDIEWPEGNPTHCHFDISVDDGTAYRFNENGSPATVAGSYRATGKFNFPGDIMIFRYNLHGPFSYLNATANYRNKACCYDYDDINMADNYWSEIWESSTNPNFVVDMVDGTPNHLNTSQNCGMIGYVDPYLVFDIAQDNPNAKGPWTTGLRVFLEGMLPKSMAGVGYVGNRHVTPVTFHDNNPIRCHATWETMEFPYKLNSTGNKTFKHTVDINKGGPWIEPKETYKKDNEAEWRFTADFRCVTPSVTCPITPCVFDGNRYIKEAKVFWGSGRSYEWDVVFRWSQRCTWKNESVNQYVPHYWDGCPSKYGKNADGSSYLIQYIEHEHCPCFCTISYSGPNNGQRWWRGSGPGYNGSLGEGKYRETWGLAIYCWSSAHGTRSIGGTCVRQGEDFYWWYETWYNSNRGSQPKSPYAPWSQPYATPYSGSGCRQPCNYLYRYPDPVNVLGPYWVDIKASGSKNYDYWYCEKNARLNVDGWQIGRILSNGTVNKHYMWRPIPDKIHVTDHQIVGECISLYIGVYDFTGHIADTWRADGGSIAPYSYAWYNRYTQAYCDTRTATICLCDSKAVIGSAQEAEGLDTSSGGFNEGDGKVDGDIWMY